MSDAAPRPTHFSFAVDRVGVATILFDRAGERVNTLSPEIFPDLETILERCETDPAVRAVVVGSAKEGTFIAGGDIRWLQTLDDPAASAPLIRSGQHALERLERLATDHGKPVVAAIHGACLGGGLEVALACSHRVGSNDPATQFGQPEIKLGLIPGAGGTQRLPRLVGVAAALDLILTGRSIGVRRALRMGLIDEVCEAEALMERARALAVASIGGRERRRRAARFDAGRLVASTLEATGLGRKVLFSQANKAMLARTRGHYPAGPAALRAVRVGATEGVAAGYAAEAEEFARLLAGPEAKALISIFFATQALKRETGVDSDARPRPVERVGIVGGGLMGAGIGAVNVIKAQVPTVIKEVDTAAVIRAVAHVEHEVESRARKKRKSPAEIAEVERLLGGTTEYGDLAGADLVIEAVFEDLELKRAILDEVERVCGEDTVFATNTSSIPITEIAAQARRPANVLGMHYFSPVERMPLLEVVTTAATSDAATATAVAFGKLQGKHVIVVNDGPGFYTTRILAPFAGEVLHLLRDGAAIEDIDAAMIDWGFPVGPITLTDEVGIDVGAKIAGIMERAFGERMTAPAEFSALIADDRKGRKNGRGFYRYEKGKRKGVDASVYDVLGVSPRRGFDRREIQERLSLQMINEAARCLEEGVLHSARDGDIGAIMGLGYPPFRGGPFFTVDALGARALVDRLDRLSSRLGDRFTPAEILRERADGGAAFRS
jgi:3-hydroxyacyl-CoA dehydrogenase/enoyl-CoA hydratase/3-hydroxybutyryl-CoA epimerase